VNETGAFGVQVLRALAGAAFVFGVAALGPARGVAKGDRRLAAFFVAVVGLFHAVFWVGLCAPPLGVAKVGAALLFLGIVAALVLRGRSSSSEEAGARVSLGGHGFYLAPIAAVVVLFAARAVITPLLGFDTPFRWNFLPLQMLEHGDFHFYPPRTAQDFETYFYVDGIPPLVSFVYWWLYATAGTVAPSLTAIFVVPQFLALLWLTFRWSEHLHSARAGLLAVVLLCACPLSFWSVLMGQETGLTALSLAGTLYFLSKAARAEDPLPATLVAAVAAGAGALSREYGCAFVLCGLFAALWLRLPARRVLVFLVASTLAAAPWYVRSWILTGNPFYSNPVAGLFPTNAVHLGILKTYARVSGQGPRGEWLWSLVVLLIGFAPLQMTMGLAALALEARRLMPLAVGAVVTILLWLYSIGVTAGGPFWAVRVLSPALVILSVLMAVAFEQRRRTAGIAMKSLLAVALVYAFLHDLVIPERLHETRPSTWLEAAFRARGKELKSARAVAAELRPLQMKVLSDNAYAHAGLVRHGVQLVPVWSPAVAFLYDPASTPERARQRLLDQNIGGLLYRASDGNLNSHYLGAFPFFARTADLIPCRYVEGTTFYLFPETASRASCLCP